MTTFGSMSLDGFLERLASDAPTPGGGSAAAIAGAMAASLLSMVAALSAGRPRYAPYEATLARAAAAGAAARIHLLELADADARAFDGFSAALKLPRETTDEANERQDAVRAAARAATEIPLEVVRVCQSLASELESMAGRSNTNASSDLVVGALLADAAARGAAANVFINLPSVGDPGFEDAALLEVTDALAVIEDLAARVRLMVGNGKLRDAEPA